MSGASGASSLRAMTATSSAIEGGGRSSVSTRAARVPIAPSPSIRRCLDADLEIDRAGEGVGDRRPFLHMGDQRADFLRRDALAFHVDLDAHVREADRLLADVTGAPDGRDVKIAFELQFELVDGPAAMHRVGVQPNGET